MVESSAPKEYREVLVVPLAARREAMGLIAVIGLIMLLMGLRFSLLSSTGEGGPKSLQPYQMKDLNLKSQAPTLFRSLLGVVGDIQDLREETGDWPDVALLKEEALPPFASDFLPMALRGYVWERHASEGWVDYFGVNSDVGKEEKEGVDPLENSFILRIIDLQSEDHPHPHFGRDNDPTIPFSYQVWMNTQTTDYPGNSLIERGWKWVVRSGEPLGGNPAAVLTEQSGQ